MGGGGGGWAECNLGKASTGGELGLGRFITGEGPLFSGKALEHGAGRWLRLKKR